jgi:hypothetical protein
MGQSLGNVPRDSKGLNSLISNDKHPKNTVPEHARPGAVTLAVETADFVAAVKQYWPKAKLVGQRLPQFIEEAFTANETELELGMYAMVNGYLFRDPQEPTSKAGKVYVKATLKDGKGEDVQFVTVMAFSGVNADALMQGKDGDAVSVTGELKLRCYEKDGTWRPAADILANKVTCAGTARQTGARGHGCASSADPNG